MSIRLNRVTKECNVGIQTVVEFLQKKGFINIEANPNTKITDEQYQLLIAEFNKDKGIKDDAIVLSRKRLQKERKTSITLPEQQKFVDLSSERKIPTGPKIVGKINLNEVGQRKPQEIKHTQKEEIPPSEVPKELKQEQKVDFKDNIVDKIERKIDIESKEDIHSTILETSTVDFAEEIKKSDEQEKNISEENNAASNPKEIKEEVSSTSKNATELTPDDDGVFRLKHDHQETLQLKVKGHIDLSTLNQSTRPKRKTSAEKRKEYEEKDRAIQGINTSASTPSTKKKRVRIGKERVDVNAVAGQFEQNRRDNSLFGNSNKQNVAKFGAGKDRSRRSSVAKVEVSDEDVAKQVKETLARLTNKNKIVGKGAKYRKEKRENARATMEEKLEAIAAGSKTLKLTEFVTANELAVMMNIPVTQVIATCMSIGIMISINQRMDAETINLVAEEFGFKTEYVSADVSEAVNEELDDESDLLPRAPIVTVMGHVDHGKTSLLDYIRKTNVIAGEAGGITQHIGAYNVTLEDGRHITFLDTPGHEAFTAMRARGAQVTDIAIIIIAADDDIMPQTKEAINHAMAANVPIVFAINKVDKPSANPEKIKEGLAAMNFLVEDWGGKYQSQDISAKKGTGVEELLEKVLLEAEMLDLKANPNRKATGSVIESSLDKGRGYVATVLVSNGTLHMGDIVLAGTSYGRVKAMFNERNQRVSEIGPAQAATILGLDGAPAAGDTFHVMETEHEAREITNKRLQLQREQGLRTQKILTLDEVGRRIALGGFRELNIIVKGDVDGSVEALADALIKLSAEKISVNVIHKAVGQISESDVALAAASEAIIIGFQVRPSAMARKSAEQQGVDIRLYSIIYDAIGEVKSAMEGLLAPEVKEEVMGTMEVRQVYHISKVGTVAGAYVVDGKVLRTNKARVIRDGIVIHTGQIGDLKRFKDDVKEVATNFECGVSLVNFNDFHEGDIIESFSEVEVKVKL